MRHILLILLFTVSLGFAQIGNTIEEGGTFQTGTVSSPLIRASSSSGNKVVGTEYLNEEWQQATVTDLKGKKKVKLLARFNAHTKEIEILKEKDYIALKPVAGVSVELDNKTFVPLTLKGTSKSIFAEELVGGSLGLFKVYDVKITKAASDSKLLNVDTNDRLIIIDKLYYAKEEQPADEVPSKKKLLEKVFDTKTLEFMKTKKLSAKKEVEAIQIFEFANKN